MSSSPDPRIAADAGPCKEFREAAVKPPHWFRWLIYGWLLDAVIGSPRALRFWRFALRFIGLAYVWRYDDVREVLSKDQQFPVPWGERMIELNQGMNFVLGMPRGTEYDLSYQQLARAFPLEDASRLVQPLAAKFAAGIVSGKLKPTGAANGEAWGVIDAVEELIAAVPVHLCDQYFGVRVPQGEEVRFFKSTLAISAYTFAPSASDAGRTLGTAAAACMRTWIRDSIAGAKRTRQTDTVLQRMLDMGLSDDVIHAHLFGMITGYIPTNVMAGANILETLLRHPDFLERARAAARAGDDQLLWRCLREALRFRHINPGAVRVCPLGYTVGEGGPSPTRIRAGSKVLALIQTAMFDESRIERPDQFDPNRSDDNYMVFGFGQHWCVGFHIARVTATQTLKPLLKSRHIMALRGSKARVRRFGLVYPLHLQAGYLA